MEGSEMRSIRDRLGLSQVEFGARIERDNCQVSRFEKGRRKIPSDVAAAVRDMIA